MNRAAAAAVLALLAACASLTADPARVDALVATFNDPRSPYPARLEALEALRPLVEPDPALYRSTYERIRPRLWEEAQRWHGLALSDPEQRGLLEALAWLAAMKDPDARFQMELHLERETVRRKRLPEPVLRAIALNLVHYPESAGVRETLWAALADPAEKPSVRAASLKTLQALQPRDWTGRLLGLSPAPGDDWLSDLQRRLR